MLMFLPSVSVLMPCRNAGPFLQSAVLSVLAQAECLELLVADGGSTDGSLKVLERLASVDSRVRVISHSDRGPAHALNKAFREARGTLIGWLNADDLYPVGALARAVAAFKAHSNWLMVYGEGEEFNEQTGLVQRYPTLPASVGLKGFRSHCFICQPSVVFRRSMGLLLGEFDDHWRTAFDFDYWLRAFEAFPHRIGYIPHLQGRTRLHNETITSTQRAQVALEATQLLARHFGSDDSVRLKNYALELKLGFAKKPSGISLSTHLGELLEKAQPYLTSASFANLKREWCCRDLDGSKKIQNAPFAWNNEVLQLASSKTIDSFTKRPFGVNLIGHAFEMFGIGEDIRMAARALQSVNIPCSVIHHPAANGASCSDLSLEHLICNDPSGGPYAFNLVCMAAPIQDRWMRQSGCDPLRERYTISSWPWETQQWPDVWMPLLSVVDELWPSSNFIAKALEVPATKVGRPIRVMPMAAEITEPERFSNVKARDAARIRYGLPVGKVLFCYGFDFNSTAIRKNPMGALEAFQRAFPLPHLPAAFGSVTPKYNLLSDQVSLLIKTLPLKHFSPEWEWLQKRASEDSRINLIASALPRNEILSLYGCCDVFLSLHRSEGFGRGLAEALQLGLDVIATDFGGNTDFCKGPLSHPVRWRSAPIPYGRYPYANGHSWAEPDLEHAAELCQKVAALRLENSRRLISKDSQITTSRSGDYGNQFSYFCAGENYRQRLESLWSDRDVLVDKLIWRAH